MRGDVRRESWRLQQSQLSSLVTDECSLLELEQSLLGSLGCGALPKSPPRSMSQIPEAG